MSDFIKAVQNEDLEKIKLLLSVSDSSAINEAIGFASGQGHLEIVKLLLSVSDPSANNNKAVRYASYNGRTEVVKLLLADPRVDPSAEFNLAIQEATRNGHIEIVKLLLSDSRVDPSEENNYPLRWASYYGHLEIVKLLLADSRVDPSANNNFAIQSASRNGHIEIIKLLLADPRVDWRVLNEKMKIRLLKDTDVKLKDELKTSLLAINRITPKMKIEGEYKALIPKSVRKNIIYRAQYEDEIKGEIPPIKLVALANLLKISYDDNISWKELCGKVKFKLLEML